MPAVPVAGRVRRVGPVAAVFVATARRRRRALPRAAPMTDDGQFRCLVLYLSVGPTADSIAEGTGDAADAYDVTLDWLTSAELLTIARDLVEADERGEAIASVMRAWHTLRGLQ
ncbi:hypothetical protein QGN32_02175 [Mycolicibacterium sp. ND9-15]|uniref:hypothetical protein n=1 Tax=Mycolicibacterium sp. ND9-15 TaxID=3042320 RepID=UPI002DD9E693|nr:hypothetical protein [Mycolicibacterium sp. ND9-15]WSE56757.1 hypothetical protein QGN32_02175 [Mycolicibacterium sp. ND9-15]